jgi:hypothetical protein
LPEYGTPGAKKPEIFPYRSHHFYSARRSDSSAFNKRLSSQPDGSDTKYASARLRLRDATEGKSHNCSVPTGRQKWLPGVKRITLYAFNTSRLNTKETIIVVQFTGLRPCVFPDILNPQGASNSKS